MFKIYEKSKKRLYSFQDEDEAGNWLDKNPRDFTDLIFVTEEPLDNLLIAKEEVKEEFECLNCGVGLRIYRHPKETNFTVGCPNCGAVHGFKARDVSSPPDSGDED